MLGVPADLNLRPFLGTYLVKYDRLDTIFYFSFVKLRRLPFRLRQVTRQIGVEGRWQITDALDTVVASGDPLPSGGASGPEFLLGHQVEHGLVRPPRSFILMFGLGHTLEVFDSVADGESFCFPQQNLYV